MRRDKANSISFRFCLISDFLLLFSVFCFLYFQYFVLYLHLLRALFLSRYLASSAPLEGVSQAVVGGGMGVNVRHRVIGTFRGEYIFFAFHGNGKFEMTRLRVPGNGSSPPPLCPLTTPVCPLTPRCRGVFNYPVWLLICGFNAQVAQIGERV